MIVIKYKGIYITPWIYIKNIYWGIKKWWRKNILKQKRVGWKFYDATIILNDDFVYKIERR